MSKFNSGLPTDKNLDKWSDYAKRNSFNPRDSKAQSKRELGSVGKADAENDYIPNSGDWQTEQKDREGKGYTFTNDLARQNSFTGKGARQSKT